MLYYCHICEQPVADAVCNDLTQEYSCIICNREFVEILDDDDIRLQSEPEPQPAPQEPRSNYHYSFHVNINGQQRNFSSDDPQQFMGQNPFQSMFGGQPGQQNGQFGGNLFSQFFGTPPNRNQESQPQPQPNQSRPHPHQPQNPNQGHLPPEFQDEEQAEEIATRMLNDLLGLVTENPDSEEDNHQQRPRVQFFSFSNTNNANGQPGAFPVEFDQLFQNIFNRRQRRNRNGAPHPGIFFHEFPDVMGGNNRQGGGVNMFDYFHGDMNRLLAEMQRRHHGQQGKPPADKETIDTLQKVQTTAENLDNFSQPCAVCKDSFQVNETVCCLPCEHYYHEGCVVPWLNIHCTCPVCRSEVKQQTQEQEEQID